MIRDRRRIETFLPDEPVKDGIPLETPSHNGIYAGPVPVRHLSPGVMFSKGAGFLDGWESASRKRGGFKSLQRMKPKAARAARKPYQYVPRAPKRKKAPIAEVL